MATVTPVNDGDPANDDWPDAITTEVNRRQGVVLAADVSKSASSWSDITGLTAAVLNGRAYGFKACLVWEASSTSGGIRIGFNGPTANLKAMVRYTGETSETAFVNEWHTAYDTASGVATVDAASTPRIVLLEGRLVPTADGTFALRYYRNTTGSATVQTGSWLEVIADA